MAASEKTAIIGTPKAEILTLRHYFGWRNEYGANSSCVGHPAKVNSNKSRHRSACKFANPAREVALIGEPFLYAAGSRRRPNAAW
jgi:hypothetical protein